jgi:hypothetical protein
MCDVHCYCQCHYPQNLLDNHSQSLLILVIVFLSLHFLIWFRHGMHKEDRQKKKELGFIGCHSVFFLRSWNLKTINRIAWLPIRSTN